MLTPTQLIPGQALTASAVIYYSSPARVTTIIQNMTLYNSTGGAVTCTVNIVPGGGTAAVGNVIFARSVAAGATDTCPEMFGKVVLQNATIQARGLSVTIDTSGIQVT